MEFKRRSFIATGGERFSILVDKNGVPDFWTTLYLTTYGRAVKHDTVRSYLNHFVHFKLWEASVGESIADRILRKYKESVSDWGFSTPVFFTAAEAQAIARHCKLETQVVRKKLTLTKRKNVLPLQAAFPVSQVPDPTVSVKGHQNRLTLIAKYIKFVAENILRNLEYFSDCVGAIESMQALILSQKPSAQGIGASNCDPDLKAPPPEVFDEVMRLVGPTCPDNPFTELVKNRNSLMFRILFETGMRSGEVLQLKIKDIVFSAETISVRRRHDDPEDTYRAVEPNAKTLERDLVISKSLIDDLRTYIIKERSKITGASKHTFLFVSYKGPSKGNPISMNQFYSIVKKISVDKNLTTYIINHGMPLDSNVRRHGFRFNLNNRLSKSIDEKNKIALEQGKLKHVSEKEEIDIRMYVNGHKRENSSRIYNLRHTKMKAEEALKPLLEKIDDDIKGGVSNDSTSD